VTKKNTEDVLKSKADIWPIRACAITIRYITLIYVGIAEIPASYTKLGYKNTMVTPDYR